MKKMLGAAAIAFAMVSSAQASDIPTLASVSPSGANFTYNYNANLAPDQGLTAGDRLVIMDFQGYVAGSVLSTNADWSAAISNTLPAGLALQPGVTDNASVPDLVFTYKGPDFQLTGGPYGTATVYSGLSAVSRFSQTVLGSFSAEAIKNSGVTPGTLTFNVGSVGTPSVPEPATWAMMMIGLGAIGVSMRRRPRVLAANA